MSSNAASEQASETDVSAPLKPHMSSAEVILLRAGGAKRKSIVEFGCGGSTAVWLDLDAERIVSVESDREWVDRVTQHPDLAGAVTSGRLMVSHADLGPTRRWGGPGSTAQIETWRDYWSGIWEHPSMAEHPDVDLVLVDGRFRVACALYASLRCAPSTNIFIHDFWKRDFYHGVLDHLAVVATIGQLVMLQRRPDYDPASVAADLVRAGLDTR